MNRIYEPARAKINLTLHIIGKRPDGYHEIESLVSFADFGDRLCLVPRVQFALDIDGEFAKHLTADNENLVTKTVKAFLSKYPKARSGKFTLTKNLPIASGIGGGSADAAATLRCLLRANPDIVPAKTDIHAICQSLGADIPVCFTSTTSLISGIGDKISPIEVKAPVAAVLINPGKQVSTRAVYNHLAAAQLTQQQIEHQARGDTFDFVGETASGRNDLQPPAIALCPEIQPTLEALNKSNGCWLSRMSGSGATCFGLFDNQNNASESAIRLRQLHPNWWVKATSLATR